MTATYVLAISDHLAFLKYAQDSLFMTLAQRMADFVDQDFAGISGLRIENWLE